MGQGITIFASMSSKEQKFTASRVRSSYLSVVVSMTLVLFVLGLLGTLVLSAKTYQRLYARISPSPGLRRVHSRGGFEDIIGNATVGTVREKCTVGDKRSGCGES